MMSMQHICYSKREPRIKHPGHRSFYRLLPVDSNRLCNLANPVGTPYLHQALLTLASAAGRTGFSSIQRNKTTGKSL